MLLKELNKRDLQIQMQKDKYENTLNGNWFYLPNLVWIHVTLDQKFYYEELQDNLKIKAEQETKAILDKCNEEHRVERETLLSEVIGYS